MHFDDFELNYAVEIPPVLIKKEDMLDFANKYDSIPIHTDESYAATTHFGKLIAPGVMSFMAVWEKYLEIGLESYRDMDDFCLSRSQDNKTCSQRHGCTLIGDGVHSLRFI